MTDLEIEIDNYFWLIDELSRRLDGLMFFLPTHKSIDVIFEEIEKLTVKKT